MLEKTVNADRVPSWMGAVLRLQLQPEVMTLQAVAKAEPESDSCERLITS